MAAISVIIPCYNAASYIEKALRALEQQTFRDFEVILVDDASPDDTAAVICAFSECSDLPITLLRNEVNSGPGISRNRAIAHSDAELLFQIVASLCLTLVI